MSSVMSSSLSAIEAQTIAQYIHTFLDLVDNLPNEISRHLSQLHQLHNNYLKLINKMNINVENYNQLIENNNNNVNNNSSQLLSDDKKRLAKRIESQLIQMQELSDEKLKYAQIIIDLIESKSKELDLDYEEILHLNDLILNNSNNNINNKMNAKLNVSLSKLNSNTSQQSTNSINSNEDQKQTMNGENSRNNDKRLLPRRACALKPGEMTETNYQILPKLTKKSMTCRTTKYSSAAKAHNFQLSMSNFYRDMARRRAKLPIKIKNKKSVSLALKRNANNTNRKSVPNSNKNTIVANSGQKDSNATNGQLYKSYNKKNIDKKITKKKKSSLSSSSTTSSTSSESSSQEPINNETSDEKHVLSLKSNSSQLNGKKESKRSANDLNRSSSISNNNNNNKSSNNKKSKMLDKNTDDFLGVPIDPNEPLYCLCNQISYGEMIGCDNMSCQLEWFHFPCVDLVHKPKGKWFCPNCRGDRSNVPKK